MVKKQLFHDKVFYFISGMDHIFVFRTLSNIYDGAKEASR